MGEYAGLGTREPKEVSGDAGVGGGVGEWTWYEGERLPKVCADGLSWREGTGAIRRSGLVMRVGEDGRDR